MPNAKEIKSSELGHNVLLLGYTGAGKTSQLLTLPGRTFCYLFDPSALHTLAGHDIDYELYVPTRLNIAAQSLKTGQSDKPIAIPAKLDAHEIYNTFANDLNKKVEQGFFKDYQNVVLDSFTTFSDSVMDRVQHLNGRAGMQPQQDDWAAQMTTIKSVVRELVGQQIRLVCTAHVEFKKEDEDEGGKIINVIRLTGQLRTTIPLLFSDILFADVKQVTDIKTNTKTSKYILLTQKDRYNPQIRCTLRDEKGNKLPPEVDVTIPDELWSDPRGKAGLGKLILNSK